MKFLNRNNKNERLRHLRQIKRNGDPSFDVPIRDIKYFDANLNSFGLVIYRNKFAFVCAFYPNLKRIILPVSPTCNKNFFQIYRVYNVFNVQSF